MEGGKNVIRLRQHFDSPRVSLQLRPRDREKRYVVGENIEVGAGPTAPETQPGTPRIHDLQHDRACRPAQGGRVLIFDLLRGRRAGLRRAQTANLTAGNTERIRAETLALELPRDPVGSHNRARRIL